MRKGISIFMVFLMLAGLATSVAAFGVGSPYWGDNPLEMQPGETKEFSFNLQNMVGEDDVTMRASLSAGSEIAEFTDVNLDYLVKIGTADTNVNVKVQMPEDAVEGTVYPLVFSFATVNPSETEAGGVAMGAAFQESFDVVVVIPPLEEEQQQPVKSDKALLWAVVIIVVLIVLWLLLKGGKKKKRR